MPPLQSSVKSEKMIFVKTLCSLATWMWTKTHLEKTVPWIISPLCHATSPGSGSVTVFARSSAPPEHPVLIGCDTPPFHLGFSGLVAGDG